MICISFDTDHLDEARMAEFLADARIPGAATFFCTRRYGCIDDRHELGPHPLLSAGADWHAVLAEGRRDFPEAVGWRSHSCVYSHLLGQQLAADGYRYVSIRDDPGRPGPRPSREAWGVWHMPIFYMDNLDFSLPRYWPDTGHTPFARALIDTALADDAVYVFDFHPVHLLLNSPDPETYLERRPSFLGGEPLTSLRFEGYGARSFYEDLCGQMDSARVESMRMCDALSTFVGEAAGVSQTA